MKKDILIMCQYFYPEYISTATLPTDLAEELVNKGLTVDAICGVPKEYFDCDKVTKKEIYNGISIRRVSYTEFNPKTKVGRMVNFASLFLGLLSNLLRFFKYKIIIVYSNPPILPLIPYFISFFAKTKFIFIAYDISPDNALISGVIKKGDIIERVMNFVNRRVYNSASRIVVLGTEMKQYIIERGYTNNPNKIIVIPNWYNEKKLENKIVVNQEFLDLKTRWPFIVLYSGNMGTLQDMDTILYSLMRFKNNKNIIFIFTGHGNKVNYVKNFIKENGITNTRMFGFLKGDDYADVLKIADLCIVSLAKGIEGTGVPSKTYGYLAAGKAVLAVMSKNTDISRILEKYNAGHTVEQGDIDGFECYIKKLMSNSEEVTNTKKNARKVFEKYYSKKNCTGKYYKMLKNLLIDSF